MRHARKDYNRIQDPEHRIPEDEPVFLIRGQDKLAPSVIRSWALEAREFGVDSDMVHTAEQWALEVEKWQETHLTKFPDMPKDVGIKIKEPLK